MGAFRSSDRLSVFSRVLLSVVAVSVLLSGCANAPGNDVPSDSASTVGTAEIVDGYDCLAPNPGGWWAPPPDTTGPPGPQHPDAPAAGRIPADFTPTTAVRCDQTGSVEDAAGQWSGVTAVTLSGDMTQLVAAMSEPDDRTGLGPCTADMELVPPLWLVDADGRAIHAHYPRDECAKTKPGVHNALAGLTVQKTTTLKQTLVVPRAALDSGCPATWAAPFDEGKLRPVPSTDSFSGTNGAPPVPPAPITDTELTDIDGMRWCRYSAGPAPAETAEPDGSPSNASGFDEEASGGSAAVPGRISLHSDGFVAGGTLDAVTAQLVADAAASEPVPQSCDDTATMFLVLWPSREGSDLGMVITVELDGCGLLYGNGRGARTLPAGVHEMLTMQTSN